MPFAANALLSLLCTIRKGYNTRFKILLKLQNDLRQGRLCRRYIAVLELMVYKERWKGDQTGLALKVINGYRHSVKLEKVSSIRNKMCALEVFKSLNGVSPHAFQNYFTRVNHCQRTRANTKNIVLPRVKSETGKKTFSYQGAKIFNQLTEEMKTETSILRFKTFCKNFNFDF